MEKPPKKKKLSGDEAILEKARKRLGTAIEAESDNHKAFKEDLEFSISADQWPEEIKRLRGYNRPMHTINRLNGVANQIVNDYRQNKLSIRVLPASGDADVDTADILAGLMRNIEIQSNADMAYVTALDHAVRGGFGYFRIVPEYSGDDVFEQDLRIRPIHNPLTVHFDPSAQLITREDAKWCFVTEMMDKEEFEATYPDVEPRSITTEDTNWAKAEQVRVAEYYEKEQYESRLVAFSNGMVIPIEDDMEIYAMESIGNRAVRERTAERTRIVWRKMTANKILDTRVYKFRHIPVIPVLGAEINVEGKTVLRSAIHYAKDPQRMFNYWRSAATESVALAAKTPWILTPEHIEGFQEMWDNVNSAPMPYLLFNPDPASPGPNRVDPPNMPIGELSMANGSSDDIKATTGIFDAALGARSNETSGRAIVARQQEGDTATYQFIDNLRKAIQHCGKVLLDMIPEYYDTERVVRILDMEGEPSMETINQEVYNPATGIMEVLNSVVVGKYDVVIETSPSFASRRQESTAAMIELMRSMPSVGQVAADLIIKGMDFPGAQQIAERIRRTMPPELTTDPDSPEGQQMTQQKQQMQSQQAEVAKAATEVEATKARADVAKAEADMAGAQADMVEARADIMGAQADMVKAQADLVEASTPKF